MEERLDQAAFFLAFNRAVRQFLDQTNSERWRELTSRNPDEIYQNLVGNTSRKAMEIAIKSGLMPERLRISGSDNTITSTIELAAIMETWGFLSSLQTLGLHAYVHAAYEHYAEFCVMVNNKVGGLTDF